MSPTLYVSISLCVITAHSAYDAYTADLVQLGASGVSGEVSIFVTPTGLMGVGSALGLEANLTATPSGANCTANNGCGVHVHSGTACTDSATQGGHYHAPQSADPWKVIRYAGTDAVGSTSFTFRLSTNSKDLQGKAFIVHNNAGGRVACGILAKRMTTTTSKVLSASLTPWNNSGTANGGVTLYTTPFKIVGAGWGNDLERSLSDTVDCTAQNGCGAHVHSGFECGDSAGGPGGHLKTLSGYDPWFNTRYPSTDASGHGTFIFSVKSDFTDIIGNAFIIHNNAGHKTACGLLSLVTNASIAGASTSTTTTINTNASIAGASTSTTIADTILGTINGCASRTIGLFAVLLAVPFLTLVDLVPVC